MEEYISMFTSWMILGFGLTVFLFDYRYVMFLFDINTVYAECKLLLRNIIHIRNTGKLD